MIDVKNIKRGINLVSLLLLLFPKLYAQDTIVLDQDLLPFEGGTANVIVDPSKSLYPLFEQMKTLRAICFSNDTSELSRNRQISIVHIGDSHIQADFITGTIRKQLQRQFGNAGRGLVTPLRMTKTGGGLSYRITSARQWEYNRLIKPGNIPIGIGGVGLQILDTLASINVRTIDDSFPGEWDFNQVTAFFDNQKASVHLLDEGFLQQSLRIGEYAQQLNLNKQVGNLTLDFTSPIDSQISFFGLELKNRRSGILYSAIGINSARYINYAKEALLCEQIAYLHPELVIISLGTNESSTNHVDRAAVNDAISEAVYQIRKYSPQAIILLTTPPEYLKRFARNKKGPNPNSQVIRDVIVNYAKKNNCPYWDLFSISGGQKSANQWNKRGYLVKDGIHFTQDGYGFQGELLYQAICKSYNNYISSK